LSPKAKGFSAILTHFEEPITYLNLPASCQSKLGRLHCLRTFSNIETMLLSHVLATDVAEYIWIIDTDTTLWSHNSILSLNLNTVLKEKK